MKMNNKQSLKKAALLLLALALLAGTVGCQPSEVEPEVVIADAMA